MSLCRTETHTPEKDIARKKAIGVDEASEIYFYKSTGKNVVAFYALSCE